MTDLLADLNDAQREAVLHRTGPLLVLAGAGSGKTRVIVHRIARLVRDEGIVPWRILAVTFTNKAAGEMRDRLAALLGLDANELWVQTFHAFGARFLRREAARAGLSPSFPIYDDADQLRLVKGILAELGADEGETLTARQALSRIDQWKGVALRPGELAVGDYDVEGQLARAVYERYEAALARAGAADFGDLLMRPVRLLEEDDRLRRRWSERFEHVLVDEFQDTNPVQYRLLRLLSGTRGNVCVVGDDDQAIYRWRGADVENILGFDRDFPGTRVVKLERNYRSTRNVLDAAHAVIARATRRREKRLWTERDAGAPLALVVGQDEHDEAERVGSLVQAERARGTPGEEIAILYRTNAQSRPLEAALRAARVPYVIVRGTSFYERAEVKDAAAYLRLALEPRSDLDLERIVNTPPRGIGDRTVERLRAHARQRGVSLYDALAEVDAIEGLKPQARRALGALRETLAGLARDVPALDAGVAVQEAITRSGLLPHLEKAHTDEAAERAENLLELVAAARELDEAMAGAPPPRDPEEPVPPPLARFLEQIALLGEADAATPEGRVALMTLHAAKGLEFTAVFLTGMEEGTFPREPWGELTAGEAAAEHDEERRLCYVGMTRAKQRLTLSLARRRMGFSEGGPSFRPMEPSRFLTDLPPALFGEAVAREVRAREARAAPRPPPQARGPVVRRHPGALPGEPHIELDGEAAPAPRLAAAPARRGGGGEPVVDYAFDQRPEAAARGLARGDRVLHASFGEGVVLSCEGAGREAKAWVRFDSIGDKLVLARFLRAAG
ncbi:MAG TPA: UvrD-helicase domain-containing protein [Anaeromyxobacter sp.]|nr:UvrD-helicase domain-containing protein [Anaeromyxobacter sp.]